MNALLDFQHVSVMRGDNLVLHDLTLRVGAGEHVALLGPNGCGKSTLIKTITRECYPLLREGTSLQLLGRDRWHVAELRKLLGIVSNELMATCTRDITGRDLVLSGFFSSVGVQPWDQPTTAMHEKADEVIARLDASHLAARTLDELSSGEARRLLIARALVHDPLALLLDEPSTSLDLAAQRELSETMRRLARSGTGIILVTHHLPDIIPEIERVILLREGRVFADGAKAEMLREERLAALFGIPVHLLLRDGYYHLV